MIPRTPEDCDRLFGECLDAGDVDGLVALYDPSALDRATGLDQRSPRASAASISLGETTPCSTTSASRAATQRS
jgi:hypothetical protein